MASAASPKRMVSSFFITLASPYRATVTQQQQPTLQAHSSPARDKQHTAVRVSPSESVPVLRHRKEDFLSSHNSKDRGHAGALTNVSGPQSSKPAQTGPGAKIEDNVGAAEGLPPPPPPPPPAAARPSPQRAALPEDSALPPPPAQTPLSHPLTPGQQPLYNKEVETRTPSSGLNRGEQSHNNGQDACEESKEVCGFCRKPVALSEPAIEALNRTYHDACFQCRSCHIPLAGKQYYNKAGIPLCEDCYQASLELCWSCGEVITDHVIRALERAYHPSCFTCTTCKQKIGEQAFAQGEVGEVYCLQDYYRKYAPKCCSCNHLIIPKEDGTDSFTVECLGRSYHENCYRCEVCVIQLSPEPNEHGCYPLDGRMLCKSCHMNLVPAQH
ncbi:filamin-binding LIM protein 1 [Pleuronectes platessa]|uniref:filamin-binding LIM protein 1 n=1 Tax=Pleuronectes platessa TaxID=8262 RepID=UPI00232A783E|nr:filamin-binding LIM protein 1 [Pleuronectes platessa]XP_053291406.1 filamin-binding LIM protein 1 [Pleuronectes platessa]XP_053291409.1 filamin-binding LIM protein 1 [Pleuronectes platessa]XP_053291414.1 filamin-binding LIM protein 1 [Pleuronectes platessa]